MSTPDPQPAHPPRWWLRPAIGLLLIGLLLLALAWATRPDGRLHVYFLATPGDAVLIQTPGGSYVLIDGGADPVDLALRLGQHIPFWQRSLKAVILTQGDEQRLPGQVAALARYRVDLALAPAGLLHTPVSQEWLRLLNEQGTPVRAAQRGMHLALDGARLTVLDTGDGSRSGLLLRLDYGNTRVLLGGAADADNTAPLTAQRLTVLAYPWQHQLPPALRAQPPQAIVFTAAQENEQPALLTSYERAVGSASLSRHVYHPEHHGTIELVSDGRTACIRSEHEPPCQIGHR